MSQICFLSETIGGTDLNKISFEIDPGNSGFVLSEIRKISTAVFNTKREVVGRQVLGTNTVGKAGFRNVVIRKTSHAQGHIRLELTQIVTCAATQTPEIPTAINIVKLDVVIAQFAACNELSKVTQVAVPSRMITFPLGDLPCSWQDRF